MVRIISSYGVRIRLNDIFVRRYIYICIFVKTLEQSAVQIRSFDEILCPMNIRFWFMTPRINYRAVVMFNIALFIVAISKETA